MSIKIDDYSRAEEKSYQHRWEVLQSLRTAFEDSGNGKDFLILEKSIVNDKKPWTVISNVLRGFKKSSLLEWKKETGVISISNLDIKLFMKMYVEVGCIIDKYAEHDKEKQTKIGFKIPKIQIRIDKRKKQLTRRIDGAEVFFCRFRGKTNLRFEYILKIISESGILGKRLSKSTPQSLTNEIRAINKKIKKDLDLVKKFIINESGYRIYEGYEIIE